MPPVPTSTLALFVSAAPAWQSVQPVPVDANVAEARHVEAAAAHDDVA